MRRTFLYSMIAAVVISSVLGIVALLSQEFGETEAKVLLSTLGIAAASILAMACSAAWERGRSRVLAGPGITASIVGCFMLLVVIWAEPRSDVFAKALVTIVILATYCAHGALLLLARLERRFHWTQPATLAATALLGALLTYMLWSEDSFEDRWKLVGILSILGSAGTILTPVFQRMSQPAGPAASFVDPQESVTCPHCGVALPEDFVRRLRTSES